jgi:hypothetical protein
MKYGIPVRPADVGGGGGMLANLSWGKPCKVKEKKKVNMKGRGRRRRGKWKIEVKG